MADVCANTGFYSDKYNFFLLFPFLFSALFFAVWDLAPSMRKTTRHHLLVNRGYWSAGNLTQILEQMYGSHAKPLQRISCG